MTTQHTPGALELARNIINQIGDLWSEAIPSPEWVGVRQRTNDALDDFVSYLIDMALAEAWDASLDAIEQHDLNTFQAREGNPYRAKGIAS